MGVDGGELNGEDRGHRAQHQIMEAGSGLHTNASGESSYICLIRLDGSDIDIVPVPRCYCTYTGRTSDVGSLQCML